jgi:hypothetical protein
MKNKKYLLYLLIIVVISLVSYIIFKPNQWTQKKSELSNADISKITFYTGGSNAKNIELTGDDKDKFINSLLNSKYYRNNSTSSIDGGMAILLISKNTTYDSIEYCGSSIFQISYKGHLFSVKNKGLEDILLKYNVKL